VLACPVLEPDEWCRRCGCQGPPRHRAQAAQTRGHRGRTGGPLYGIRRVLRTGSDLLTDRQRQRLTAVFATEQHVEVEATWGVYQRIVAAYRNHDRAGTSNGPTEAINGRLEHLRGSALGFHNLTNYIARSLLETGGFKPQLHRQSG